ncbi:MAG: methionine adenosyltransferase [Armatimonadetes bacterium]|nr:methionine adenosyltransferase [Armatimonadota bacterium]MBS1710533.1 methionine adenosyltransferase [Armatimonadota bacterium]MBX3108204.1 methionine adenosyltransferase [Fimbriimonadaceae bacterium]
MATWNIYTSESVSEGHPDKLADQISDALLDEFLRQDLELGVPEGKKCRVAIETMLAHGVAIVSGEVTSEGYVSVQNIVRETIKQVGYTSTDIGFDGDNCGVLVAIQPQSSDIAMGVDTGGAGDQGMMFGMACNESPELMPLPISIAHALTRRAAEVRRSNPGLGFRPDAKSQVSVRYEDGKPVCVDTIVFSQQHEERVSDTVRGLIQTEIVDPVLAGYSEFIQGEITTHYNPTGRFVRGGPAGDTGLTGRKIIVDTYGGMCPHGGGAFSGKDPTKVDRSAAYMARHIAKCVVAAGLADRAVIGLAYAIGVAQPVSVNVETFGTETMDVAEIAKRIRANFDMSPRGINQHLDLRRPIYLPTAKNGHFGNPAFPWEDTAPAAALK